MSPAKCRCWGVQSAAGEIARTLADLRTMGTSASIREGTSDYTGTLLNDLESIVEACLQRNGPVLLRLDAGDIADRSFVGTRSQEDSDRNAGQDFLSSCSKILP